MSIHRSVKHRVLVPQRVILYAPAEMSDDELDVLHERRDLLRRDGVRPLARERRVHGVAVELLHLHLDAVIHQRIDVVIEAGRKSLRRRASAPACVIGCVLILTDTYPAHAGVEHGSAPMAVPGQIWLAGQVGVDAEAILDLRGALGRRALLCGDGEGGKAKRDKCARVGEPLKLHGLGLSTLRPVLCVTMNPCPLSSAPHAARPCAAGDGNRKPRCACS